MSHTPPNVCVDMHEPLVFRTTSAETYRSTTESGTIWLRSGEYYRALEDKVRNDGLEGVNVGAASVPLRMTMGGVTFQMEGPGAIGQEIRPHYLISLHGPSISTAQRSAFGGHTFGVRNLSRLSAEVLHQASKEIRSTGYRYGPVSYQFVPFGLSYFSNGSPIGLGGNPPVSFGPLNTDVLRKRPVAPFIEQDEWRIVIFTDGYLLNDAHAPLRIVVDPSHFYPYTGIESTAQRDAREATRP